MPRPRKWRRICCMPRVNAFNPVGQSQIDEFVTMSVDEYEIIRLIDFNGLTQDESAEIMGVARSTVQRIYDDARKKLADFLINAKSLKIEGGDYRLCHGNEQKECGCYRYCHQCYWKNNLGPERSNEDKT